MVVVSLHARNAHMGKYGKKAGYIVYTRMSRCRFASRPEGPIVFYCFLQAWLQPRDPLVSAVYVYADESRIFH